MSTCFTSAKEELVECLSQQLSEIELLKSMYPNPGEITLTDSNVMEINKFIDSKSEFVPDNLDVGINLVVNDVKLEICVHLPLLYPTEEPDIYIRCNQLNRHQEKKLNAGLLEFIKNNHTGEVCLYTAITWLQDNIDSFTSSKDEDIQKPVEPQDKDAMFCRMWIHSHHIYNKKKREDIVKLAREYDLTGFCLPGKPGIICVEGTNSMCNEWWKIIKSMCWKKIGIRNTEMFEYCEEPHHRKFSDFTELQFKNPSNSKSTMSQFSQFMVDKGFGKMFNDLFGFDNIYSLW